MGVKKKHRCKFCWAEIFGKLELEQHCTTEHPGGARKNPVLLRASEVPVRCPYCMDIKMFRRRDIGSHIRLKHPGMPNIFKQSH